MDKTNETENMKSAAPPGAGTYSSTSRDKSSRSASQSNSKSSDNLDDDEELEIDEVTFSGGCPCSGSSDSKSF